MRGFNNAICYSIQIFKLEEDKEAHTQMSETKPTGIV